MDCNYLEEEFHVYSTLTECPASHLTSANLNVTVGKTNPKLIHLLCTLDVAKMLICGQRQYDMSELCLLCFRAD